MASVTVTGNVGLKFKIETEVITTLVGPPIAVTVYNAHCELNLSPASINANTQSVVVSGSLGIKFNPTSTVTAKQQVNNSFDAGLELGISSTVHTGIVPSVKVGVRFGCASIVTVSYAVTPPDISETPTAVVINAETFTRSEYANFEFNSMASCFGKQYGASENGLFLLEGDTDNGSDITTILQTGLYDSKTDFKKSVGDLYLGGEIEGQVEIRIITDNETWHEPIYIESHDAGVFTHRIELFLGALSRYWGFEIRNVRGSTVHIDSLEYELEVSTRR